MKYCLLIGFYFFALPCWAQTKAIHNILQRVYTAPSKKQRLNAIVLLDEQYRSVNRDTLDKYAALAVQLADKTTDKNARLLAQMLLAADYLRWGWVDSCIASANIVLAQSAATNPATRNIYFAAAYRKGLAYGIASRYKSALEVLYDIAGEAEKYKDSITVAKTLNSIAGIANFRKQAQEALALYPRALAFITNGPASQSSLAGIYVNKGESYFLLHKKDSAIFYCKKGIELYRNLDAPGELAIALQRLATIYLSVQNDEEAEKLLIEMVALRKKLGENNSIQEGAALAELYIETGQLGKAIAYCQQALQRGFWHSNNDSSGTVTNIPGSRLVYYEILARCYKLKGDRALYLQTLEQLVATKDTVYAQNSARAIAEMQTKYEVQKKEATIAEQKLAITQKNYLAYGSTLLVLLGGIITWLIFKDVSRRQKLKLLLLKEEEKNAIARAEEKERRRIAADLHDNLGAYAAAISSNADILENNRQPVQFQLMLDELQKNAHTMVAQLGDTIWALNKESLSITAIGDRIKVFINRIQKSYSHIYIEVQEDISVDTVFTPTTAFHIFQMSQEIINNALKHSKADTLLVEVKSAEQWQLQFTDKGIGMSEDASRKSGSNGIRNLKMRAEESGLTISWRPNSTRGTIVIIEQKDKM